MLSLNLPSYKVSFPSFTRGSSRGVNHLPANNSLPNMKLLCPTRLLLLPLSVAGRFYCCGFLRRAILPVPRSVHLSRSASNSICLLERDFQLMNVGLLYTPVSIYQMTRGALVLFVGFLSVVFLRRRLWLYQLVFRVAILTTLTSLRT